MSRALWFLLLVGLCALAAVALIRSDREATARGRKSTCESWLRGGSSALDRFF